MIRFARTGPLRAAALSGSGECVVFGILIALHHSAFLSGMCLVLMGSQFQVFEKENNMLRWALLFLIVALIAGALGLFRVEAVSSQIAWILFVVFLILALVSLLFGRGAPPV
jgi:uncharacterized membrane protein YtjA (UPF0391 family)